MRATFNAALIGMLFLASACSHQAPVPVVDGTALAKVGPKQPGRYAAFVQTGGWALNVNNRALACSLDTFDVDINPSWEKTAKEALTSAVQKVDFVSSVKSPQELKSESYDAIIILTQSNAKSEMAILPKLFVSEAITETSIDLVMVVNWADGRMIQESVGGRGRSIRNVLGCEQAADVVGQSAGFAIRDLVKDMIVTLKLHLAQRKS